MGSGVSAVWTLTRQKLSLGFPSIPLQEVALCSGIPINQRSSPWFVKHFFGACWSADALLARHEAGNSAAGP